MFSSDFNLLVLIGLAIVMYAMGFRLVKKDALEKEQTQEPDQEVPTPFPPVDRNKIILSAIDSPLFVNVLTPELRNNLRRGVQEPESGTLHAVWAETTNSDSPYIEPAHSNLPFEDSRNRQGQRLAPASSAASIEEGPAPSAVSVPNRRSQRTGDSGDRFTSAERIDEGSSRFSPNDPKTESIRSSWDPAVIMLYLGALLVVVAGLIFATYNWGSLGNWQKLGMLGAVTIAFLVAGFAIRNFERVKPASITFIMIGGLLVPANFLAAYSVFDDVQPALPLLFGAIATAIVHGFLSYQPGASIFRYSAIGAAVVAFATVPAALGFDPGWGGVLGLVVIALMPDNLPGLNRFQRAWMDVSRVATILLIGFTVWQGFNENGWMMAAMFVSVSMVARRFSIRYPSLQLPLLVIEDVALIGASVQVTHNLDGDRWLLAAGLVALTLVLLQNSRRMVDYVRDLELAAVVSASLLVGEVVRVLGTDEWVVAAGTAALALLMLVHARRHASSAPITEAIAAVALPVSIGSAIWAMTTADWGVVAFATALTVTLLVHARFRQEFAAVSDFVAALSLPFAVGYAIFTYNHSNWSGPVAFAVVTFTLILYGSRYRFAGDFPFALASVSGIVAVLWAGWPLGVYDSDNQTSALLVLIGLVLTVIANVGLARTHRVSEALKDILRVEALPFFFLSMVAGDFDQAVTIGIVALAMFWNLWLTRNAWWSLPLVGTIAVGWISIVVPTGAKSDERLWWFLGLAAIFTALAWRLDRRTAPAEDRPILAGSFSWLGMGVVSVIMLLMSVWDGLLGDAGLNYGLALMVVSVLYLICRRSTGAPIALFGAVFFAVVANYIMLFTDLTATEHAVVGALLVILAGAMYFWTSGRRIWIGFAALVLALAHIQMATDLSYLREILMSLVVAWGLVSIAIVRWRSEDFRTLASTMFVQAMLIHLLAPVTPALEVSEAHVSRPDLVLVLISLAGVLATFGALLRSREVVLIGSAIGMSALMLQINIGSPGSLHAYTVPLSIYLIAVGLMLRKDPRIANVMLAAGSAMLVIPAMIEALTTGDINWLWIALAESVALFLFGTILRLRIPTAAGVIAVSVIVLRMLLFVVNALASWVSILAVGISLLVLGTLWLIFREVITSRMQKLFARWRAYD